MWWNQKSGTRAAGECVMTDTVFLSDFDAFYDLLQVTIWCKFETKESKIYTKDEIEPQHTASIMHYIHFASIYGTNKNETFKT